MKMKLTRLSILFMFILLLISAVQAVPLSVVESQYIQFEPALLAPAWSVIVRGDNSADYLLFARDEDVSGIKDVETVQAGYGFELSTNIVSESCDYALVDSNTKNDVYKYRIELEEDNVFSTNTGKYIDNCIRKGAKLTWGKGSFWFDIYCLYEDKVAFAGDVKEGVMNFEAKFDLRNEDGTRIVDTVASLAKSKQGIPASVTLKDNNEPVAIIRWIGGSTYGEFCPGQDEVIALQKMNNQWITASKQRYNEYNANYVNLKDLYNTYYDKIYFDEKNLNSAEISALNNLVQVNNQRSDALLQNPEYIASDGKVATFDGAKASLELPRDHLVYLPDFQIFLKADWLKLVYLSSKPRITAAGFTNCDEGSAYNNIEITVKNVGESKGQFLVGAKCEEGLIFSTSQRSITLDPDEAGTVNLPFTVSLLEDTTRSCLITVQDSINEQNSDSKTVTSECSADVFCTIEGQTVCRGQYEYHCQKGQWEPTGTDNCNNPECDGDGTCDTDLGESFEVCGGKTSAQNDCATCNFDGVCDATETMNSCAQDCSVPPPQPTPTFMYVIIGIVAAIALYLLLTTIGRSKKGKRRKRR